MTDRSSLRGEVVLPVTRHWQHSNALSPEVLEALYEINRVYLDVLTLEQAPLAALDPALRTAIARCPFALFNARFSESSFWMNQIKATAVQEPIQRFLNFHRDHPDPAAFTDLALFYSWHLVQSNPLAARVLLGMTESTLKVFRNLTLSRVQRIAAEQDQLVTPRWLPPTPFWRGLIEVFKRGPVERIEDVRLLGIQMIASQVAQDG